MFFQLKTAVHYGTVNTNLKKKNKNRSSFYGFVKNGVKIGFEHTKNVI